MPRGADAAGPGCDAAAARQHRLDRQRSGDRVRPAALGVRRGSRSRADALAATIAPALLLIDDFARTTGPREGRALLVALVEALAARGTFALVTTHFEGVALAAGVAHLTIAGLGERSLGLRAAPDLRTTGSAKLNPAVPKEALRTPRNGVGS